MITYLLPLVGGWTGLAACVLNVRNYIHILSLS